ncbi:hypothetical protein P153DRAFT_387689 [Dothidotthia symphoricarpi CBS 119687]|uniref:Uncharacterized protein n=1 Tax=Dothidotthia symphoricarpi CBS 119687 TaxID=1392245 RepID=A0A6A6A907_9PLEO|nr:uncharacterized protein P153DRAFT_387689 [Dothidotthia symphoricarpi CBS 119687]KAF2127141.1 hypothetical protein P153DRAFT_387689 [Dothidotthia symphoricarpi CBS 119687]
MASSARIDFRPPVYKLQLSPASVTCANVMLPASPSVVITVLWVQKRTDALDCSRGDAAREHSSTFPPTWNLKDKGMPVIVILLFLTLAHSISLVRKLATTSNYSPKQSKDNYMTLTPRSGSIMAPNRQGEYSPNAPLFDSHSQSCRV